ncbi:hypothetical protein M2449_004146 [Dysgonomonas sp. PF1-16]|nr:hypothetical protein [Dysgonomonas sp. PF1-16]MDH6399941.1 hypothetical protein [Dysgonomonas sp. PF1-23]
MQLEKTAGITGRMNKKKAMGKVPLSPEWGA